MSLQRVAFSPLHTFTRATDETFFNQVVDSFGNVSYELQTAPSGTAVQNAYDPATGEPLGLQVFEQRTNYVKYSQNFTNALWTKVGVSVTASAGVSPDGTNNAHKLATSLIDESHRIDQIDAYPSAGAASVTWVVKADEYDKVQVASVSAPYVNYDLTNNIATASDSSVSGKISDLGNGWKKLTFNFTAFLNDRVRIAIIQSMSDIRFPSFVSDGGGVLIYSAQAELGSFPTPYIKTEATTATRNASVAVINDIDESEWWNASEGSFEVTFNVNWSGTETIRIISFDDGTLNNRLALTATAANNYRPSVLIASSGNTTTSYTFATSSGVQRNQTHTVRVDYRVGFVRITFDGVSQEFTTTTPLPLVGVIDRVQIVRVSYTTSTTSGHIAQLIYTPSAGA